MTYDELKEKMQEAKEEIKRRVSCKPYLHKAKHGGMICPFCGSGTGKDGTGALKYYEASNSWVCHSDKCKQAGGKHRTGDVIDLHQQITGADYQTALIELGRQCGVDYAALVDEWKAKGGHHKTMENKPKDFTAYYAECRKRLPLAMTYLKSRGISMETATRYGIGFDPKSDPAGKGHPCPRLIIPTSATHYVARRTDGGQEYKKMNPTGSKPAIFNHAALTGENEQVFVCEGAMDALSIMEAGGVAVATNSTANTDKLIDILEKHPTNAAFILCFDNDEAGKRATETLRSGLTRLNIRFIVADICGDSKDPNEALVKDRASFLAAVDMAKMQAMGKPDNTSLYIDKCMQADIEAYKGEIMTGFEDFDRMTGGLYPGLYIIAAISSLGKTTLCLQMAEQIAASGKDVIFFTLEQSKLEMVSKGIARRTGMADKAKGVTSLAIRKGANSAYVREAAELYKAELGDRFSVIEGSFKVSAGYIGEYVRRYMANNNTKPVVFVDYLQILQADDPRMAKKDAIDKAVSDLRQLAIQLKTPIVAVSSVNRANYLTPIDFESLKESGGIEFTADAVFGLQLQCLNQDLFQQEKKLTEKRAAIKEAKAANPRKVELTCLKNRGSNIGGSCYFDYYPAFDLYETCTEYDFPHVVGFSGKPVSPKVGREIDSLCGVKPR
jgi:replicative DNA helicase